MSYYNQNSYNQPAANRGQQQSYGYQQPQQAYGYTAGAQPATQAWNQAQPVNAGFATYAGAANLPPAPVMAQSYGAPQAAYGQPPAQNNTPYRAAPVAAAPSYNTSSTKRSLKAAVTKIHEKFCFIDQDIFCQLSLFRPRV